MDAISGTKGWNQAKVEAFRREFLAFLAHVRINSKEKGGNYKLADGIYDGQRIFLDAILGSLAEDIHDIKILKSRQLGITTFARALGMFWVGIHPGLQGAMIFDTDAHMYEARKEFTDMIGMLPASLKFPKITDENRYGLRLGNTSFVRFMSAGVRANRSSGVLGRSSGINFVMASELCSWENDEGIVSLQQSLSETYQDRLYLWESTARGFNAWKDMWDNAKIDILNQRTCFIGWWAKPTQRWERGTPQFERHGLIPPTVAERARIQAVYDQYGWEITQEQLAWYRGKVDPSGTAEEGTASAEYLQQDQPWTEEEAFIQTGSTFFSGEKLTQQSVALKGSHFTGYRFIPGNDFVQSDFEKAKFLRDARLKVWEEPIPGETYILAADPAYGHDEKNDRSAANVLRCYADRVEQVAEFASPEIETEHFAWLLWSLIGWYKDVLFILELNGPGEAVWNGYKSVRKVVQFGYLRKEAEERGLRDIFNNVRNYVYARSDSMYGGSVYQFKTTTQLKVMIFERLRDFSNNGILHLRSTETIEEMKSIRRDGDTIKAAGKKKDDRAFTLAMGCYAWDTKLRPQLIAQNRTKAADEAKNRLSMEDQYNIFRRHQLGAFFKRKESERGQVRRAAVRRTWREGR